MTDTNQEIQQIRAQAHIHHAYLLGLQLAVTMKKGPAVVEDWMFRLFRRQHEDKFLSSFEKLGLASLPDAVACAKYHVLSNGIGGVGVEFMPESDHKAWVRFRYPRWMYHGPTICGVPVEVSRGFLRGWYAHNGVSLKNPRLGFVCVSEDMTGEYGLCGYFKEYNHELADEQRLVFAKHEVPPVFEESAQPRPPEGVWTPMRLEKAGRNYALEYIRNGLSALLPVIGEEYAMEIAGTAARLIGLQYFQETADMVGAVDGSVDDALDYLARMFQGMGDDVVKDAQSATLKHHGLRILRGLEDTERAMVLHCWIQLWRGTLQSQQIRKSLTVEDHGDYLLWRIT